LNNTDWSIQDKTPSTLKNTGKKPATRAQLQSIQLNLSQFAERSETGVNLAGSFCGWKEVTRRDEIS